MQRRALITGVTGQDGLYLAELLLAEGYEVHGASRRPAAEVESLDPVLRQCRLHRSDLLDYASVLSLIGAVQPDEVYHLAAPSFVPNSWEDAAQTANLVGLAVPRLLQAIRQVNPAIRYCQAGSASMFGNVDLPTQNESTPFCPSSPYGAAKAYAHWVTVNYRQQFGMFAANAILFNHESPRRAKHFVTRKISDAVARIKLGRQSWLTLGDLDARRDWGFAGDYVRAMWLMLQHDQPGDYVIASGQTHRVGEAVELAFAHVGLDWRRHVDVDATLARPAERHSWCGDSAKALAELGWRPLVTFERLITMMVDADLQRVRAESPPSPKL